MITLKNVKKLPFRATPLMALYISKGREEALGISFKDQNNSLQKI